MACRKLKGEGSPSCLLRLRLTLSSSWIALFKVFAFSLVGKVLLFGFHAAIGCRQACSAFTPMAQMNPSSSRPTAVMTFLWSLPAIVNFL